MRARACSSVSDLVSCDCGIRSSPSGLSLRKVPAGRIARSCVHPHRPRPILLRQAGRALRFRPCGNQVLSGNLPPNNSFKPSPLRGLGAKPVRLGRAGLTQALGVEMPFRSRARRKHLRARACSSVSDLASCDRGIRSSPSGLSLRQVPAGRIARSCVHPHRPRPILLRQAGKALRFRPCGNQVLSGNLAPNNSFKPSPLRGLVAVSLAGRGPA